MKERKMERKEKSNTGKHLLAGMALMASLLGGQALAISLGQGVPQSLRQSVIFNEAKLEIASWCLDKNLEKPIWRLSLETQNSIGFCLHFSCNFASNAVLQGRELDYETGLYYFRNRHFNPELGRFMQADPLGYHDSMNLYQAFGNNPVNFTDPMGTDLILGKNEAYEKLAKNINKMVNGFFNFSKYSTDPATRSFGYAAEYLLQLPENAEVAFESAITGTMGVGIVSAPLGSAQLRLKVLNAIEESAAARKTSTIGVYLAKDEQINAKLIFSELPDPYTGVKQASKYLRIMEVSRADRIRIIQSFIKGSIKMRRAGMSEYGIRYFNDLNRTGGSYLFETFPASRSSLSIKPEWNKMLGFRQFQIRPETWIIEGRVSSQGAYFEGGQMQ